MGRRNSNSPTNAKPFSLYVTKHPTMRKLTFLILTSVLFKYSVGQSDFKNDGAFYFNFLIGYQSFFKADDINTKLVANNFTKLSTPGLSAGFDFGGVDKKTVLTAQFRFSGIFTNQSAKESILQSTTIGLQYGRDLLKNKERTYLYPFLGFRMFDHTLTGQSSDGKKLDALKVNFDFITGFGFKQFLNAGLKGVFNNLDLSIGASLPAINGRWKKDGAEYVTGTFKLKPTYFLTFSIGRGFRPAGIR